MLWLFLTDPKRSEQRGGEALSIKIILDFLLILLGVCSRQFKFNMYKNNLF